MGLLVVILLFVNINSYCEIPKFKIISEELFVQSYIFFSKKQQLILIIKNVTCILCNFKSSTVLVFIS